MLAAGINFPAAFLILETADNVFEKNVSFFLTIASFHCKIHLVDANNAS